LRAIQLNGYFVRLTQHVQLLLWRMWLNHWITVANVM